MLHSPASRQRRSGATRLSPLILGLLILAGCLPGAAGPTPPPLPTPRPSDLGLLPPEEMKRFFGSPEYGIHLSQWWWLGVLHQDLALTNEMGFGWVKQKFAWRDIEGQVKGHYDWYRPDYIVSAVENAGLKLVVRIDRQPLWSVDGLAEAEITENQPPLDLQDFTDFCGELAGRYTGRIAAYQVWNEPNLSREWGEKAPDPAHYTALLRGCYLAIKAADPDAIVISAGLAPTGDPPPVAVPDTDFLQAMYEAGAGDYFDVLGVNAPGYNAPPEVSPQEAEESEVYGRGRWFTFRRVEDIRAIMVANGDAAKQVAILEMGWTTDEVNAGYAWHRVSEAEQADYLVRAYRYAAKNWQPWIGLMVTIYFADGDWNAAEHEQWWWAIVLPDGTRRPAFDALREMPKE
jgi:polysaccharide biosynthesis protein PslG